MEKFSKEVWVFVEQHDGKAADVSLELLCKGRKLADKLNGVLKSVVLGHNVKNIAEDTFKYGVNSAIVIDHPALEKYRPLPYSRMLNKLVNEKTYLIKDNWDIKLLPIHCMDSVGQELARFMIKI